MSSHDVYTVTELAKRWRCSRRTVVEKIHSGEIGAFRIGKRCYRIAATEVERIEKTRIDAEQSAQ